MKLFSERPDLKQRDPKFKAADKAALQAIAQAAVNVELFTIPLYMVSLYSIAGVHQITSKGNDFYQGRLWPGQAPSRDPLHDPWFDWIQRKSETRFNARVFNIFFSIFIDEMLHLQLAANIAKVLGVTPSFTSPVLMNRENYGWTCYGPGKTVIPQVLDFKDTIYPDMQVQLDALTDDQIKLFLAIEENDKDAEGIIKPKKIGKYFPSVPFEHWKETSTEADLPMFGTIGCMYKCLWEYMEIEYTDNTTLFQIVFTKGALQRDLFNAHTVSPTGEVTHKPEYPLMHTTATGEESEARGRILDMINAITDQGEGQGVAQWIRERLGLLQYAPVEEQFQPDYEALKYDYPNYTDTGALNDPSGNAKARHDSGGKDHHDRFLEIEELVRDKGGLQTWKKWHEDGNSWSSYMLETKTPVVSPYPIPKAEEVADALNSLKRDYNMLNVFSQIAAGSIAGITRVLNDFWTKDATAFPYPSMYGSGDRVSICWAIFGKPPDLSVGIDPKTPATLYHACQGLSITSPSASPTCAPTPVAHSCKGSNTCKAEGGCGFVQLIGSFANCGGKVLQEHLQALQSAPTSTWYSAPSDNSCAGTGGCAVPISASQMFPPPDSKNPKDGGTMALYDVTQEPPELFGQLNYTVGELVYDVAWKAYIEVLQQRKVTKLPEKPAASLMRLALPPST